MIFRDRIEAGQLLGEKLARYRGRDVVVLGLPRGGIPVAAELARLLDAPLDVLVVRKIGVPRQPEVAMGAVGEGGVCVRNDDVIDLVGVGDDEFMAVEMRELGELERRCQRYRGGRQMMPITGRTVIIVDDGIATGATALAAVRVARAHRPDRVVVATPVSSREAAAELDRVADEVVALQTPADMLAVGYWYRDFSPTSDHEVERLLADAGTRRRHRAGPPEGERGVPVDGERGVLVDVDVSIDIGGGAAVEASLAVPDAAIGLVVLAHGTGSSRHSPRNRYVADALRRHGIATLLVDLVTPDENDRDADERDATHFDIELLAARVLTVMGWVREQVPTAGLPIGLFGASTGAAVALRAAADPRSEVAAIVTRGGRPDLAATWLDRVTAPTLLIVGGDDGVVVELNRAAAVALGGPHRLVIVPGATHLFEEPGALDTVARDAAIWFEEYFRPSVAG